MKQGSNLCEDERLAMKNNFILIKNVLPASTTTSILTCLQLTRLKALSTYHFLLCFPSVHPAAKVKAQVLLPEQRYH